MTGGDRRGNLTHLEDRGRDYRYNPKVVSTKRTSMHTYGKRKLRVAILHGSSMHTQRPEGSSASGPVAEAVVQETVENKPV